MEEMVNMGSKKDLKPVFYKIIICVCLLFTVIVCAHEFVDYRKPTKITTIPYGDGEYYSLSDYTCQFNVDYIDNGEWYRNFVGWAFIDWNNTYYFDTKVILYDESTGEGLAFDTEMVERKDMTELHGQDMVNYDNCGFKACIPTKYCDKTYKLGFILLDESGNEHFFATDYEISPIG